MTKRGGISTDISNPDLTDGVIPPDFFTAVISSLRQSFANHAGLADEIELMLRSADGFSEEFGTLLSANLAKLSEKAQELRDMAMQLKTPSRWHSHTTPIPGGHHRQSERIHWSWGESAITAWIGKGVAFKAPPGPHPELMWQDPGSTTGFSTEATVEGVPYKFEMLLTGEADECQLQKTD